MNEKIPCTVEILTHNSGKTLRRALESVKDFAEIIVIDGKSSDDTLAIAHDYGARVIPQDSDYLAADGSVIDFAGVRNQGLVAATQPWFFFLDSDEYMSAPLIEQVQSTIGERSEGAYWIVRKYMVSGIEIACAASYPNRSMRLFARGSADRFIKHIHERIRLREGVIAGELPGPLLVPVNTDMARARKKRRYYIALQVEQERGVSLGEMFRMTFYILAVSGLYLYRALRARVAGTGTCLPWYLELDTQAYQYELIVALWKDRLSGFRA